MEKVDKIWAMIIVPLVLFGPLFIHEFWTRRKKLSPALIKNSRKNKKFDRF